MTAEATQFAVPDASWKVAARSLPKTGTLVRYRTAQYQLLGYVDSTGHWVATDGTQEPLPVKAWREIAEPLSNWPERAA